MHATADSKTIRRYSGPQITGNKIHDLLTTWLPRRVNKRWPAIIFAANRTESVIGRITFLTISITTINGIRTGGVPLGTRWAKKFVILFIILYKINLTHKGKAKESVIAKCLVAVKVKDKRPTVLFTRINEKILTNKIILIFLFLRRIANSLFIVETIFLKIIFEGLE